MGVSTELITLVLPKGAKVRKLEEEDLEQAFRNGILKESEFWPTFFNQGYDAVVGLDSRDSRVVDVMVNPKHLK
jgi:hypothetical protein